MQAVLEGLVAGFGIAVPVGAIGVLIVDRGATRGFAQGAAAGTGTALADGVYAIIAVALGTAAARLLPPSGQAQAVSAVILGGVAGWMLRSSLIAPAEAAQAAPRTSPLWRTTATFLALTVVNPVTVVYFSALVTGLDGTVLRSGTDRAVFAVAAFVASLSWQLSLAAAGSVLGHRLTERSRRVLHPAGAVIVVVLAIRMALRAVVG